MSHYKERAEKVCLNCGADLIGHYCHRCGQENRDPRSTVWGLITHFFYDITHFDGKFFSTTGRLISRPGFLPKEYVSGRRASYLDPIRMYIFSSAIFFLIFLSVYHVGEISDENLPGKKAATIIDKAREDLLENAASRKDSLLIVQQLARIDSVLVPKAVIPAGDPAADKDTIVRTKTRGGWQLGLTNIKYKSKEDYDSAQSKLTPAERDGWLVRKLAHRTIEVNKKMRDDQKQFWRDVISKFKHSFPYLLFVSLPLYALYLKLLYIRRKKFYYVDHGLFLIFLYIFTFIFLLFIVAFDQLGEALHWDWLDYILPFMFAWGLYYGWRAMHKFYGQGKWKTTIKFLLFNLMCLVSLVVLFCLFFIFTVFSI